MKKIRFLLTAIALVGPASAFAADATLNFSGTIILPTCTVNSDSVKQDIDLKSIKITDFTATTANPTSFKIDLENCVAGTNVSMTVNGTTDTVASVLKNTGDAAKVGVQLLKAASVGDTTGTPITLGSALALGVVDATNKMTIPMVAQFYKLGTMTAGAVAATATVNFTYN
ncbi:fimbrial protein [Caballeronia ptereochthonis]|uniref:Fimbrial subunit type 1 n=1 Tax=Caballeronia ptereochthonis TaxID=1777144 RepID=A0A158BW16_9BURK|nr:fimbrial protein [Caballeronia ptereochthonis]SAK74191.1 fimbrial subunit type 1 [Caballeronia ptereochthonis]